MSGVGNIYRTEILWRQAVHPEIPGKAISRQAFDRIWNDAAYLLAIGVKVLLSRLMGKLSKKTIR